MKAGDVLVELQSAESRAVQRQSEVRVVPAQVRQRHAREAQAPVAEQALRQAQKQLEAVRPACSATAVAEAAVAHVRASTDAAHARARYAAISAPVAGRADRPQCRGRPRGIAEEDVYDNANGRVRPTGGGD